MLKIANNPIDLPIDDTLLNENIIEQVPVLPVQQAENVTRRTLIETVFS